MKTIITILFFSFLINVNAQENSKLLVGTELTYKYEKGNHYHVKIEEKGVSYQYLSGSKPTVWWGPFEFNSLQKDNGEYILAWYERGYGDYVTLNINFEKNQLYGSALIISKAKVIKHLQKAVIEKTNFKK